ncbi:MAG: choice-of-anchor D domain-containing protein, partial [Chthoniobacterales bacterium]
LSITGAAYRYANPTAHTPEPVAFGNFHVGDTNPMMALSMTNNVLADGFSEALNASIGGVAGGIFANGSFSLLAPGATNNTSLLVGFSTSMAGSHNGTASIFLQSDGTGSSGLGITNLASQIVNVSGAVYRYAAPVVNTPLPVAFANSHVGDFVSQALSVTNNVPNDTFSERLDASFTGSTGNATASGLFALLGAGATNNSSLLVGLDTSMAGFRSGSATIGFISNGNGTSGLGTTALPGQTVNVSGNVYRYANPTAHTPEPIAFGVVHIGDAVSTVGVSLTNNVPADGFSESLNATIGGGTNGVTASGSFTHLAPGATNNSSLQVGINTATAGSRNGTATIGLISDGASSSGLGLTTLPSQTVNVTGQVNFYADPVIIFRSGSASLIMNSATNYTLDFGQLAQNSGTYAAMVGLLNLLHDATYQDTLGGTFDLSMVSNFLLTGFNTFAGVTSGTSHDVSVGFDSNRAAGTYSNSLFFNPTSGNTSSTTNLGAIQLNLQAQVVVVPEPSTWGMIVSGTLVLLACQRSRRRVSALSSPARKRRA